MPYSEYYTSGMSALDFEVPPEDVDAFEAVQQRILRNKGRAFRKGMLIGTLLGIALSIGAIFVTFLVTSNIYV